MAKSGVTVFSAVTSTITILLCLSLLPTSYATVVPSSNLRSFYTRAHSLGDEYEFTALEGWYTINATDLGYKYNDFGKPSGHQSRKTSAKVVLSADANVLSNTLSHIGGTIVHLLNEVWNDLKGFGKSEQVKITWYTGHDLENPSCWSNPTWAPTVGRQTIICVESPLNSFGLGRFFCLCTYSPAIWDTCNILSQSLYPIDTAPTVFVVYSPRKWE